MAARLIGICGTLSTGKTTLARSLASKMNIAGHVTEYATEAATDYIIQCGAPSSIHEEYSIFLEQMKREKDRCDLDGVEFVISDCPAFLTHGYAIEFASYANPKDRFALMELYRMVSEYVSNYWKVFYIPKAHEIVNNGVRVFTEDDAIRIDQMIQAIMTIYKIDYHALDPAKPAGWVNAAFRAISKSI
jgi:nicotinamide riboside kinase